MVSSAATGDHTVRLAAAYCPCALCQQRGEENCVAFPLFFTLAFLGLYHLAGSIYCSVPFFSITFWWWIFPHLVRFTFFLHFLPPFLNLLFILRVSVLIFCFSLSCFSFPSALLSSATCRLKAEQISSWG